MQLTIVMKHALETLIAQYVNPGGFLQKRAERNVEK